MKQIEMLNQIKTLLNIEVKLEEMKLENGTIVSAESFEKGKELFIVTDDEKVAMPVGEYLLEDGRLVVVEEEGIIADVREVSDEVPAKETEDGEEITSDLKEEEKQKGFKESTSHNSFFSTGKKNQWKSILNNEQTKKIEKKFSKVMRGFNYI